MKNLLLIILAVTCLASTGYVSAAPDKDLDAAVCLENAFVNVSDKVGPAVVSIYTTQERIVKGVYHSDPLVDRFIRNYYGLEQPSFTFNLRGLGSGMIINKKGDILTNYHVVRNADEIMITLNDGRTYSCKLISADPRTDTAVIRIGNLEEDDPELPVVKLGNSDTIKPGQWAIALGNPFGIAEKSSPEPTMTVGVISAVRSLSTATRDFQNVIQTDAAINPGNSGGPLCNIHGEVVGINTFIVSAGIEQNAGVGFATPINRITTILDDLVAGREVQYGWLGVVIQDITEDLQDYFKLDSRSGALVSNLQIEGPADTAGIRGGDIVLTIDGIPIKNATHLTRVVSGIPPYSTVDIIVLRDGKRITIPVKIGKRPGSLSLQPEKDEEQLPQEWRGIKVINLPEDDERFEGRQGILVDSVREGSSSEQAGLVAGDVITQIGKEKITGIDEFYQAVQKMKSSVLLLTERGFFIVKPDPGE
jgi:Do/DeqQ family serine protease